MLAFPHPDGRERNILALFLSKTASSLNLYKKRLSRKIAGKFTEAL